MKIAIDCHTLEIKNWAGKEQYLISILKEIAREDKANDYFLYFRRVVFKKDFFPSNWKARALNLPTPFWQLWVIFDLLIRKINILFAPCVYLLPALNFYTSNIIVIHDLTAFLNETKKTHKVLLKFKENLLVRRAIKNSTKIIAVSRHTKEDIIKLFGVNETKIKVIGEAAQSRFRLIDEREKIIKILAENNIPDKFILYVGTLEPRKNLIRLVKSYKEIIDAGFNKYKLVLVGKRGWYYDEIFKKVKELNLENEVLFTGYLADGIIPYLYNAATCFVYPSFYEGFGLPVVEAMACGCPVITSNISSLPEIAGNAAILINPYKKAELVEAFKKILIDNKLRSKMSARGLVQAKKFSWGKTAKEIIDLYGNK